MTKTVRDPHNYITGTYRAIRALTYILVAAAAFALGLAIPKG